METAICISEERNVALVGLLWLGYVALQNRQGTTRTAVDGVDDVLRGGVARLNPRLHSRIEHRRQITKTVG